MLGFLSFIIREKNNLLKERRKRFLDFSIYQNVEAKTPNNIIYFYFANLRLSVEAVSSKEIHCSLAWCRTLTKHWMALSSQSSVRPWRFLFRQEEDTTGKTNTIKRIGSNFFYGLQGFSTLVKTFTCYKINGLKINFKFSVLLSLSKSYLWLNR